MRRPSAGAPRLHHPIRGFTLIELLVVMTLLSLVMAGLVSALRSMAQTESKVDQRLERLDEIRVARTFLQQTLNRVSNQSLDAPDAIGKSVIPFVATQDSVSWVGIMPARFSFGGRYFFRLAVESPATGPELTLRFLPWAPDVVLPDWAQAEVRTLVKGVQKVNIQAQGLAPEGRNALPAWPNGWQNGWPVGDVLPEQLRLGIVDDKGEWAEWIFALHALPLTDISITSVAVGGG